MKGFYRIEGIIGECNDEPYRGWTEMLSFSHGVHRQGTMDRADHMDVSVIKVSDRTSPTIALSVCDGRHFREARVILARNEGARERFMELRLQDVTISSYRPGASMQCADARPIEEVSLHYEKIEWIWVPTAFEESAGREPLEVKSAWTLRANTGEETGHER